MIPMRMGLALGVLLIAAFGVRRDTDQVAPPAAVVSGTDNADSVAAIFATATPVSSEKLDEMSGKAQLQVDKIQINDQDLNGVVTDNVAIDNQTGHNTIADGAYTNAAGFMTTIQNTGNNVLIQNATIINLTVEP